MWVEAVDRELRSKLPVALAPHVRVANVAQGRLSLRTSAAAWANRARLQSDDILQAARSIGLTVERVEIRVAPMTVPTRIPPEKPASPASRAAIEEAIKLLGQHD